MVRFVNLLQAPTVSIYQLVKTITFVLYLFDMVEMYKIVSNSSPIEKFMTGMLIL